MFSLSQMSFQLKGNVLKNADKGKVKQITLIYNIMLGLLFVDIVVLPVQAATKSQLYSFHAKTVVLYDAQLCCQPKKRRQ